MLCANCIVVIYETKVVLRSKLKACRDTAESNGLELRRPKIKHMEC